MIRWKKTTLNTLVKFGNGKERPKQTGPFLVYGGNGVLGHTDAWNYDGETIIIGRVGAYCGSVYYENGPVWVSDNALAAKPRTHIQAKFLYYFLKNLDLNNCAEGSSHPLVTQSLLNSIEVSLPEDYLEQVHIAELLSSLDDKINLLHRQNKTLEGLSETLFRQWFVEEAEEWWEKQTIREVVSVIDNRGKTPPYQLVATPHPLIEVNALTNSTRLINYDVIRKYVSEEVYQTWFRGHPTKYDTLVSTVGSIGEFCLYLKEKGTIAQNVIAIRPLTISPLYFYQYMFSIKETIASLDIGAVQPSIKVPHLLDLEITVPDQDILKEFDNQMFPIIQKMENNDNQISTLANLRDTLLPKLMSGEVRVNTIK